MGGISLDILGWIVDYSVERERPMKEVSSAKACRWQGHSHCPHCPVGTDLNELVET